ncbi:MAG: LytTR family transcriptional regulator [Lachnospiraceae bacterium]|nr:LytTR family transcriptional regulator [Lachnospiraceae bacterium]
MRIYIEIEEEAGDTVITIKCREKSAYIDRLVAAVYMVDRQIMVARDGEMLPLDLEKVLYMESVDGRCFVYTQEEVYETGSRLYELEQQLGPYLFVRANKSSIVNLEKIQSIRTYVNRRLLLTMANGEQLIASRQYAENIKRLLGVGKG